MRRSGAAVLVATFAVAVLASASSAAEQMTVPAGQTSTVALPTSNIVATCTPPGEFHPNPTTWVISPSTVKVSGLTEGQPPVGATVRVAVPRNHSPYQPILISWSGNTKCVSYNGSITLNVGPPGPVPQPPARPKDTFCTGPTEEHTRLMREAWLRSPTLRAALAKAGAKFQSNKENAPRPFAFDRFEVTITKMPPGVSPEQFLERFADNPNTSIDSPAFNALTYFRKRGGGPARVGTIYDIKIPGDDGSVIIVEKKPDHFIVQTIETPKGQTERHPVSGAREFGFTRNRDGSVTFYTQGADRPDHENLRYPGWLAQNTTWNAMMAAIADELKKKGATTRGPLPKWWRKDIKTKC